MTTPRPSDDARMHDPLDAPLAGIRVIDLSEDTAGPYVSKLLAGLGAEVIKVEPPRGDTSRGRGPFKGDVTNRETSAPFLFLNTGKQSIVLDTTTDSGRGRLLDLLSSADMLIESFGAGGLEARGIAVDDLRARFPRLIVLRISDFGQDGPYRDFLGEDIVLQALGGLMFLTGEPDQPPLRVGGRQAYFQAGLNGFVALMGALLGRDRDGRGRVIDLSALESVVAVLETAPFRYRTLGQIARRDGNWANRAAWGIYPCADGYAAVVSGDGLMFRRIGALIPELDDRRYDSFEERRACADAINAQVIPWLMARTKDEVYAAGQAVRLPFGAVRTTQDLVRAPHLQARGFFARLDHPVACEYLCPVAPFRFRDAPWQVERAPLLDEHAGHTRLLAPASGIGSGGVTLGDNLASSQIRRGDGGERRDASLPLNGVRVLDLTMVWAGPFATKFLADMGAEVIKLESLRHVDSRLWAGFVYANADPEHPPYGRDAYVVQFGRNKLGATLDLASEEGKRLFLQLVAISDVVIENFAFGVLDRLGFSYDTLRDANPAIVVASMPGFGVSGPDREHIAYGTTLEALSGLCGITGYSPDEPHKSGINYGDPVAGMHAAGAVMAALRRTRRTGRPEFVEVAQLESLAMLVGESVVDYALNRRSTSPAGNADRQMAPHGVYPCRGEDRWIAIAVADDEEWRRLVETMGAPDWADDATLTTAAERRARAASLDTAIAEWTRDQDQIELMHRLQSAGVRAGAVLDIAQILADPHLAARGLFAEVKHPDGNTYVLTRNPWLENGRRESPPRPAPALGQHNEYVFGRLLGLSASEQDDLTYRRLIGTLPIIEG